MPDSQPLTRQVALVTGGTRGIGRAVAASLLRAGAEVVLTGTGQTAAERAAGELAADAGAGAKAHGAGCDVRDDASVGELADFIRDRCGRLDILVNNAGVGIFGALPDLSVEDFRRVVDTNLTGVFRVTKALLPFLLEAGADARNDEASGAVVVNIGSLAGRHSFRGGAAYNSSKFGLIGLTEAMMLDLREHGIRVATVMPGSVATGFADRAADDGQDWKLSPEDVAEAVLGIVTQRSQALASRIELRPSRPPVKRPPDWRLREAQRASEARRRE